MTTEKVKVTKEVAEAIERLRKDGCTNFDIINRARGALVSEPDMTLRRWAFDGSKGTPDELMVALIIGYEVEKSPEEIIAEAYGELSDYESNDRACKDGFRFVLDTLGIKIEGVNAE